jgi:hypothetical protein
MEGIDMFKKILLICLNLTIILYTSFTNIAAEVSSIYVGSKNLLKHEPADKTMGDYYVLKFQVPVNLKEDDLEWAFLEFFVDVASIEKDKFTNECLLIQVYALKTEFSGKIDPDQFATQTIPTIRNVVVGKDRLLVFDITEIVRSFLANPENNNGLIICSLGGTRDGIFSIRNDKFNGAGIAKFTFLD